MTTIFHSTVSEESKINVKKKILNIRYASEVIQSNSLNVKIHMNKLKVMNSNVFKESIKIWAGWRYYIEHWYLNILHASLFLSIR